MMPNSFGKRGHAIAMIALGVLAVMPAHAQRGGATMPDWWPGTPERVAIRAQIEALSTEYYYRIDHGDAESVAELFTPDGVFQPGGSPPLVGREAVRAYYARRSKTFITRHVSTNLRLTYVDARHVEAVRVFTHYLGDSAEGAGPYPAIPSVAEYRETLVRGDDGQWRYASRVAMAIFSRRK